MKTFRICLILLGVVFSSSLYAQCKGTLVFSDEFNGSSLDLTKWNYDLGNGCPGLCGWGNNEREYYTNSTNNVFVSGGYLNLVARYEPNYAGSGSNFTSGKIHTRNKFDRTYGRFEARMKLVNGVGMWPAFWLLPADNVYGAWPTSGEIDIMENRGDQNNTMSSALHYGSAWPANQHEGVSYNPPNAQNLMSDFHIFAVEWDATGMRFFCDGALYRTETRTPNTLNPASNHAVNWPWDQDFYIILNLALGGWYSGNPDESAILASGGFPKGIQVDYVRVYSMNATISKMPFTGTAFPLPGKLEAENYDDGCENYSYNDFDIGNTGNAYRYDNVDIEGCADVGTGYNVGWINVGDWMEYTVNVSTTGLYDFTFRVAGDINATSTASMTVDGAGGTGTFNVPETNGWQTWQDVVVNNVSLTAGTHVLRFNMLSGGFNLNYINVTAATLPVSIAEWSAQREDDHVLLNWISYKEENNEKYILERSADGINYSVIYETPGQGHSAMQHSYSYIDYAPLTGVNYYRLKQRDLDGTENICGNTIQVFMNGTALWEVYPVPFNEQLQLSAMLFGDAKCDLVIYDTRGMVVAERKGLNFIEGTQHVEFNTGNWAPGVYTVNIINHTNGTVVKKKIIKE